MNIFDESYWLWHPEIGAQENQYVDFHNLLDVQDLASDIFLYISADSDYAVFVNGNFAGWNQYPDWPRIKTYNTFNITEHLKRGMNCIAICVYYRGEDFFTYAKGKPGLLVSIRNTKEKLLLPGNSSWKCRQSLVYSGGPIPKVTVQLGYTFQYDARKEDDRELNDFDSSKWINACELCKPTEGFWQKIQQRPISNLKLLPIISPQVIGTGNITRHREYGTVAKTMMEDALVTKPCRNNKAQITSASRVYLSEDKPYVINVPEDNKGIFLLLDIGREESGLLTIDIDAPSGTVLDIAHGEHIVDLRVRAEIDGRNFADRYICKAGRQKWFYPFRKLGCRYLQVHIPKVERQIKIYNISLQPIIYPFAKDGSFNCNDSFFNKLWDISIRTLELCAHEHYEDCPWREQALYGFDSRIQALYSYYAFGDYEYAKASFDLLGFGLRDDGLIELTAPAKVPVNIPSFSLHWICALYENYLFSGDSELLNKHLNTIIAILDKALERITTDGVVSNSKDLSHWHMYEWTEGLEGELPKALAREPVDESFDAVYNLLLITALNSMAEIGKYLNINSLINYKEYAEKIKSSFHDYFWDTSRKAYASFKRKDGLSNYAQFTQALALLEEVVPESFAGLLIDRLKNDQSLIKAGLPSLRFVYDALLKYDNNNLGFVLEQIRNKFGKMLYSGATSLWETEDGEEAFSNAGSLCHAWSSIFVYIAGAYLLGVKPLEPGFKTISFKPDENLFNCYSGNVPTPYGKIGIKRNGVKTFLNKPDKIQLQ